MKHLKLPAEVLRKMPITDMKHTLQEIDTHRHVHAMIGIQCKKRSAYMIEYHKREKAKK